MEMKRFSKNLKVVAIEIMIAAFACVSMWGCGLLDEEVDHVVDSERYNGIVFAIIDDSLALETNGRRWTDHTDHCDYLYDCKTGSINQGVFLVNYRNKQKPLWGDTIDGAISIVYGYYHDSSTMFSNANGEFGFWRIGEKPRIVRKWNCEAPCECNYGKYGRPWIGGSVLLKMESRECPVAILDTTTGIVKKLEFVEEYAWLEGCDDITYIDSDVLCIRQRGSGFCEIDFEKNDLIVDSLMKSEWMMGYPPRLYGNAIRMQVYALNKEDRAHDFDRLTLINNEKIVFDHYPETWMNGNSFVDSTGSSISYSSDDLVITK